MLNIIETSLGQCQIYKHAISTLRNQSYLPTTLAISLGSTHAGSTFIYTDGLKSNNSAGCVAIIGKSVYSAKSSNSASSYTAELIVILLVIKNVLYQHSGNIFTIFIYSKSALAILQNFYPNNPIT